MRASTSHAAVLRLTDLVLPGRVYLGPAAPELPRRLPSGSAAVDALLDGGWPQGRISELSGPLSSGKTALVMALLATTTRRGETVACVDLADSLHSASIAAAGADLHRVLWVRPPSPRHGTHCTEIILQAGGFAVVVLDLGHELPHRLHLHTWPRLLHAAERSHTALVVVASQSVAGSFAAIHLRMRRKQVYWHPGLWPLFDGFESVATVERSKLGRPAGKAFLQVRTPTPAAFPAAGNGHEEGSCFLPADPHPSTLKPPPRPQSFNP